MFFLIAHLRNIAYDHIFTGNIQPERQLEHPIDKNLIQINVSSEELEKRINNFIERKREQVNINNINDFIPTKCESETEDTNTCARVRTQFVKRSDSKGHLKSRSFLIIHLRMLFYICCFY